MNALKQLRAVCVDNQRFILNSLNSILKKMGISQIQTYSRTDSALSFLQDHEVDIVITGLQLDHQNGLDLIKQIRVGNTLCDYDTPIVVVSSIAESHIIKKAQLLDVDGYLLKPFSPSLLGKKILTSLQREHETRDFSEFMRVNTSLTNPNLKLPQSEIDLRHFSKSEYINCAVHSIPLYSLLYEPIYSHDGSLLVDSNVQVDEPLLEKIQMACHTQGINKVKIYRDLETA